MRKTLFFVGLALVAMAGAFHARTAGSDARLKKASRAAERNGWIPVHLEGTPSEIGFQHGYLLAPEIADNLRAVSSELTHGDKNWAYYRKVAREVLWPRVETEYRDELNGMAEGLKAHGVRLDIWDLVALNGWLELPYYDKWREGNKASGASDHCSAFVATGSYTTDGRVVIGHNNWTSYSTGERWNVVFDIEPAHGYRFVMDGMPGLIHSGDDFGLNAAGIVITETTIGEFIGFDPDGVPEFVRARKAMQYSQSIEDFARIMKEGNNGGYANNWLVADRKTNEIADLELGLKNVNLERTRDGYFVGSNFPVNPKLMHEETKFDPSDKSNSENARHARWLTIMEENKGKIDVAAGKRFLGDHFDTFTGKEEPCERTLCGHVDLSPRGMPTWQGPFAPVGAVQNKVADAASAERMTFFAALGHACGRDFHAAEHLEQHPEYGWYRPILHDMNARAWTELGGK
jgi:hypothetical protein